MAADVTTIAPRSTAGRMLALRAHQRGGTEQLVYEEAPRPAAGPGEVRIAVGAAAITFAELTWPETRFGPDLVTVYLSGAAPAQSVPSSPSSRTRRALRRP